MAIKTTIVNEKSYSLYPMTGTEALRYAYDVGAYILPSFSLLVPKVIKSFSKDDSISFSNLMDNPKMLEGLADIDFEEGISSFFRNCPQDKFIELWLKTREFIKEGDAKTVNWELEFQGDAFGQIKLMGSYIKAYITPFLSSSYNFEKTTRTKSVRKKRVS
jgi:hypothetical protein